MNDLFGVQGDIGFAKGGAVTGVEGGIPLFVFVTEADNRYVALLDQSLGADGVDLGGLMVAPEAFFLGVEYIASGVAGFVVGVGGSKGDIQFLLAAAFNDLIAPVGVDFAGEVDF